MKNGIITIIIFTIVLIVFYLTGEVYISNSSIDIHIHDTYFVLSYWIVTIGIISLLFFAFSLGVSLSFKFKKKLFNWLLLISSAGLISI